MLSSKQREEFAEAIGQRVVELLEPRLQAMQTNILRQIQAGGATMFQQAASSNPLLEAAPGIPSFDDRQGLVVEGALLTWH